MFSTSADVQYIGGYHEYIEGYHVYIRGCSVHRGDIIMNVGGYHEYIGGCSVHWRDTMSTLGDIMSTSVHVQNFFWGGGKPCPLGWHDSYGKTGNFGRVSDKSMFKMYKIAGVGREGDI